MTGKSPAIRRAFRRPVYLFVRVDPKGFVVEDEIHTELTGRVARVTLIRKLFTDGVLDCHARDGVTAEDGNQCDECRHPRCTAQLRIHLSDGPVVYVVDLAPTAARNFLELHDEIEADGTDIADVPLRLTVKNQGRWGLVIIQRRENPPRTPRTNPRS